MLRFKKDDGTNFPDWKEVPLSSLLKERKTKALKDGTYEHVSLTKEGVVPKSERYERDFLVKSEDKAYKITKYNDICYNPANLKFGVICRNKYKEGIFSPIYITFETKKEVLPEFVEGLVTRTDFINYSLKYQEGTVYERMSVSPEDLLKIKVQYPCIEEQKKIVEILSAIETKINNQNSLIESLENQKRSFIQKIFSQELRFTNDTAAYPDWEEQPLGELFDFKNGYNSDRDSFMSDGIKCIGVANVYMCKPIIHSEIKGTVVIDDESKKDFLVEYGDVLFQRSSETMQDIGHASVYIGHEEAVYNGFVIRGKKKKDFYIPECLHYLLQADYVRQQTVRLGAGAQHYNIGQESLAQIKIKIPCIEEQKKIAEFLMLIDEKIKIQSEIASDYMTMQKALLQQLYPPMQVSK